jgi:N-acetyl-gamma-glutamyl-phosphate reductase
MSKQIRAGIIGAAGYTGGELLRLLLRHPAADIAFAQSKSSAGKPLSAVHGDLLGETELKFSGDWLRDVDVIFLCSGHGEARSWLAANDVPAAIRIIDLSHDFRLTDRASIGGRQFIYGLPELQRDAIREASSIANPGCFATAIQLGLLPLAEAGLLNEVSTTGITGSTGAGQGLSATSHFSWRSNNIQAYKTLEHQHVAEIEQSLNSFGKSAASLHFVPWRGDFARGIYVTSVLTTRLSQDDVSDLFKSYYSDAAFSFVSDQMIDLKQVVNTNRCVIFPEVRNGRLAVHSAIDNLLKGASGQAVQNMNLIFGIEERSGLQLKASAF